MLSKEDLEELGWSLINNLGNQGHTFKIKKYLLFVIKNNISISNSNNKILKNYIYKGIITDKEELKILMKKLNING